MSGDVEVIRVLRDLIRLDTSNPPGREIAAVEYIAETLRKEGIEPVIVEPKPGRANVVARLKGNGSKPPLMLSAHLDVVPEGEGWDHPAFGAEIHDGYIWGRGAVDMKQMAAMSLVTVLELKRRAVPLARDVIFAGVADEEAGGRVGAGHLVDHRRELIAAEYCLTELGGMAIPMGNRVIMPVQVAERGYAWLKLKAKGIAGHGSIPRPGSAVEKLSQAVSRLCKKPLNYRLTPEARTFLAAVASSQSPAASAAIRGLMTSTTAPLALKMIPEERRAVFRAMLYDTASVTMLNAGSKVNVVPGAATAEVDGRYLPGVTEKEFLEEIRQVVGPEIEISVTDSGPPVVMPARSELMEAIVKTMAKGLPEARVVPYLMAGVTDAKHYSRADITTYGFAPVALKPEEPFASLYHAPNERISVEGVKTGLGWLYSLVSDFCRVA